MISLGASGVQMGTRFIGTYECDAHENLKKVLLEAKEDDIQLMKSPVGYPAQGVVTNLTKLIEAKEGPGVKCISNCVAPCNRGEEAKEVGFCIADRLSDAYLGNLETGLFFSGANGYKLTEIISVKELMEKLTEGE
jgi:nitronate monooxygenase